MGTVSVSQGISDALAFLECAVTDGTTDPLACISKAIPLLKDALLAIGPIAASSLDPADRAKADAEAQAAEDAKFGKQP